MGRIFAMSGGENGWDLPYNMKPFDDEIISMSLAEKSRLLFIGFAAEDEYKYYDIIKGIYEKYGCEFKILSRNDCENKNIIMSKIEWADIIYVGGGNTYKLMKRLRRYSVDEYLRNAYFENKVLCGISAGAICWCQFGNSKTRKDTNGMWKPVCVSGIGIVPILFCPHVFRDPFRVESAVSMIKRKNKIVGMLCDNVAIEIIDEKFRIVSLMEENIAMCIVFKNREVIKYIIPQDIWYGVGLLEVEIDESYRRDVWLLQA